MIFFRYLPQILATSDFSDLSSVDPLDIPDSDESGEEHEHYNPNRRVGELPSSRYSKNVYKVVFLKS